MDLQDWMARLEAKVDGLAFDVAQLKVKLSWKNALLAALTGLAVAIAASLMGGCNLSVVRGKGGHQAAEMANAVGITVWCIYPGVPSVDLTPVWPTAGPMSGTGVAVGPGAVMTARHVIACDENPLPGVTVDGEPWKILVATLDGESHEFVVEKEGAGPSEDAALLVATGGATPFRVWAELGSNPARDAEVCAASVRPNPLLSCGPVEEWRTGRGWVGNGYFKYRAFGTWGNSGSGVYDADGKLVGILVGGPADHSYTVAYAVSEWRDMVPEAYDPPL